MTTVDLRPDALDTRRVGRALQELLGEPTTICSVVDAKVGLGSTTVLYRLGDRLVIVGPPDDRPGATAGRELGSLGLVAWVFPDDPALPGLAGVLTGAGMAEVLRSTLPECRAGARLRGCSVQTVRYRPGRRATLRVDVWLQLPGEPPTRRTYYAKIYHDRDKAAAVSSAMSHLADSGVLSSGLLRVPFVAADVPEIPMLVQTEESGSPLDLFLGPLRGGAVRLDGRARIGVRAAAEALALLHQAGPSAGRPRDAGREAARMLRRAGTVAATAPEVGAELVDLAKTLLGVVGQVRPVLTGLHGDCKPSQFLVRRDGTAPVTVLDFDHAGPGHPAADVGGFTASLRQLGAWQTVIASDRAAAAQRSGQLDELADEFVDEYRRNVADAEPVLSGVAYHEPAALLRKALRAFARSPRSPMPHALAAVARQRLADTGTGSP